MLPNFLGIGTQRAATTWLYNCLKDHPDIYLPDIKEVLFFSKDYEKGLNYYESFFKDAGDKHAVGEISPEYLYCKKCPNLIAKHLPDVKMIIILRNPIDRAYSAYNFFHKNDKNFGFEDAINERPGILKAGLYYDQLVRYFSVFDRSQFLILLYEDLMNDNFRAIKNVCKFVDVNPEFSTSWINKTVNTDLFPKTTQIIKSFNLEWIIGFVKKTPLDSILRSLFLSNKKANVNQISFETKKRLIEYYSDSNDRLGCLLGRDFKQWSEW